MMGPQLHQGEVPQTPSGLAFARAPADDPSLRAVRIMQLCHKTEQCCQTVGATQECSGHLRARRRKEPRADEGDSFEIATRHLQLIWGGRGVGRLWSLWS